MRPELRRRLWPAACVVLLGALLATAIDARNSRRAAARKLAKLEQRLEAPVLTDRERDYLGEFGRVLGAPTAQPPDAHDAARLAAYAGIELHKQRALARGGDPATYPVRHFTPTFTTTVPLAAEMSVTLPAFQQCRYELVNKSDRAQPAPILFQGQRWDSAPDLVATAGFPDIADELDRATAIWRWTCVHRDHALPVTQDEEEHDVVKFFAIYGYGFCDDTARALATLAELSGLRGRVWFIGGHVVAEIFAAGHWRMFDADQQVYFHRTDDPRDILGVEELSKDRAAFNRMVTLTGRARYAEQYIAAFLSREDNEVKSGGTADYRIRIELGRGDRIVFTNYNWGRFFLGRFPTRGPRLHNGWLVQNPRGGVVASPFPIVGGMVAGSGGTAMVEDREHGRQLTAALGAGKNGSLDGLVSVLTKTPTTRLSLNLHEAIGAIVLTDFQFAPLAWLPLRTGENHFQAFFPEGCDPAAFELVFSTK